MTLERGTNCRFAVVIGTRPEAIKLLPVYLELRRRPGVVVTLIATGQHRELVDEGRETFGCVVDISLNVMQANQTLSELTAKLVTGLSRHLTSDMFDAVVVQGDTTTAMISSMVAFYHSIAVAHVEAGLRTGRMDLPFPEGVQSARRFPRGEMAFCTDGDRRSKPCARRHHQQRLYRWQYRYRCRFDRCRTM